VAAVVPLRLTPFLALALLGAACTGGGAEPEPISSAGTTAPASTAPAEITGAPAELITVFDGDTLLVRLDGVEEEVRLLGINAPERDECFGSASRAAATALLEATPLLVEVIGERDQFGRLLAYVWAGGLPVNRRLLEEGHALVLQTDHPRRAEFLAAEERAFTAGTGLWAAAACGAPARAAVALADIEPDPPGPDEDDPNGEWVLLANREAQRVDLSYWMLRDESSQNRYRFPDGFSLDTGAAVAVHTGCGNDGPDHLYWCAGGPVWNNGGDTALLLDPAGNVAARLRYGG
jgi:endonuclease YncB( thermonuclease family)